MNRFIESLREPFELLNANTSDRPDNHGVYADTRSRGEHFSITSTQSGTGTYAVHREHDQATTKRVLSNDIGASKRTDSEARHTHRPSASDD
jgi:hypothetical protein